MIAFSQDLPKIDPKDVTKDWNNQFLFDVFSLIRLVCGWAVDKVDETRAEDAQMRGECAV
jgi:hypothetical protein